MKVVRLGAAACVIAWVLAAPAGAQNLSLRAPQWAQAMLSTDVTPTTGGRPALAAEGVDVAVRVTIAPHRGGVARVIRYDQRGQTAQLALRRFTGHPSTGWWMWGPDTPRVNEPTPAQRTEVANLARAAMGVAGSLGGGEEPCLAGEQAYIEVAVAGRAMAFSRACTNAGDAASRLAQRVSDLAGSRTEEEFAAAVVTELLDADRAFAAMAAADGVPAAFARYAAPDALMVTSETVFTGAEGVTGRFQNWPQGAKLEWAPETARVSTRGDMGWTWGNATYTAPDGTRSQSRYVTIWTRDYEGAWRFAFDAGID